MTGVSDRMSMAAEERASSPADQLSTWQWWRMLMFLVGGLGLAVILLLTLDGPGVGGDSVHYLMGAENLADGEGFSRTSGGGEIKPITHFPPFFSFVLTPFALLGADLLQVARVLNAGLFAVTIGLVMFMVHRSTRSTAASLAAGLLLVSSEPLLMAYSYVMTEATYVVLSLVAIWMLAEYMDGRRSRTALFGAALLVGASLLTRYAGVSLLAACAASVVLFGEKDLRARIADGVLFAVIAAAPLGLWFFRNRLLTQSLANRQLVYHPMSTELINTYLGELVALIFARQVPLSWRPRALLAGAIAWTGPAFLVVETLWRRLSRVDGSAPKRPHRSLRWLLLFYAVAYFATFVLNSLFFDAGTTLSVVDRYLAPGYVALVLLAVITTHDLLTQRMLGRIGGFAGAILAAFLIVIHIAQAAPLFGEPGIDLGYMRVRNENPEAVDVLRELNPEAGVVSNNPELFYVLAGRPAYVTPIRQDPASLAIRDDFGDQVGLLQRVLDDGGALVLLFPIRERDEGVFELVEVEAKRSLMVGTVFMKAAGDEGN